ncbi:hypothetical protein [Capybara microvirus Cap1_SP_84]|nr:hypothetical protein [Capybara microvirus Cap1_SP_84]
MQATITFSNRKKEDFNPLFDREKITIQNRRLLKFQAAVQGGYETRMYYEYLNCIDKGGFVAFVTLTYNNKALYHFYGLPVPDSRNLRYLLHDSYFAHECARSGYNFKYFITTELGEGKGKRGFANNPHYHCLLYFTPSTPEYNRFFITRYVDLIKKYWQGDNGEDWNAAKFGHVEPGDNYGIVNSSSAFSYVSKYVTKSSTDIHRERIVAARSKEYWSKILDPCSSEFKVLDIKLNDLIKADINKYRNLFGTRVRCSHGFGQIDETLLTFIHDKPHIKLTSNGKLTYKPLPLYNYRKLYMYVDENKCYKLNEAGIELKCRQVSSALKDMADNAQLICRNTLSCCEVFSLLPSPLDLSTYIQQCNCKLGESPLFHDYALYTLLYKDRMYPSWPSGEFFDEPDIDPLSYIRQVSSRVDKNSYFFCSDCAHLLPYKYHSRFRFNLPFFSAIDSVLSHHTIQTDEKLTQEHELRKRIRNSVLAQRKPFLFHSYK